MFDIAFDFRDTAGFVSDPAYAVAVLGEGYPHTYTNANGTSVDAGWVGSPVMATADRDALSDPRIAGVNFEGQNVTSVFRVNLASGSAPGRGTYVIDIAQGDHNSSENERFILKDDTTTLFDSGLLFHASGSFADATGAIVVASTTWTGATANRTFSSTICNLEDIGDNTGHPGQGFNTLAHFRLTFVPPSGYDFWHYYSP